MRNKIHLLNILVILLIIFLTYGNMLDNFFLRDEVTYIKSTLFGFKEGILGYEQALPVVVAIHHYINIPLWELNPEYFYLQNLLLHLTNVLLFYFLCLILFRKIMPKNLEFFALISSLFFAVSYSNNETVLYLNGFPTLLKVLFALSSLLWYYLYQVKDNKIFYFLSVIFFALSVFSHPAGVVFLIVLLIYDYLFFCKERNKNYYKHLFKISVPFFIVILSYFWVGFLYKTTESKSYFTNFLIYGFHFLLTSFYYLSDLFLSLMGLTSSMIYYDPNRYIHLSDQTTLLILRYLVIISFIFLAFFTFQTRKNKVSINNLNKVILFGVLWCVISFLPYSTRDILKFETFLRYRYLYLPSIGFSIFIGCIIYFMYEKFNLRFQKLFLFASFFIVVALNSNFIYLKEIEVDGFGRDFKRTYLNILQITESKKSSVYLINHPVGMTRYYGVPLKDLVDVASGGKTKVYFAEEEETPCYCLKEPCYFMKYEDEKNINFTDVSEKYKKVILQECK